MDRLNRRSFLKAAGAATAGTFAASKVEMLAQAQTESSRPVSANDHIQIALIGAGGQGQGDTHVALRHPGIKLMAVSDLYDGRLVHAKEMWGDDIMTTKNYAEILERKDIDAVIVATPDHWHKNAAIDVMKAGKDVYCEKPMIHLYSDGPAIIETARATKRMIQIGSQRVSSIVYAKAKELLASGIIGELNMINAWWDRNSASGAFDVTLPLDATTQTCDWERWQGDVTPKRPFSAEVFFRWRKYKSFGSGVAGDLFVHLFSGIHFVTGSTGPNLAMASGGIRFWKDGRDEPDVLIGLYDYPQAFNVDVRVNFVDGGSESSGFIFTGSEGTMQISGDSVSVSRVPRPRGPGYDVDSFADAMQKEIIEQYEQKYPREQPKGPPPLSSETFSAGDDYSDSYDHFSNFFRAVRTRQPVVEDAVFGFRAAGAALLSNVSYESGKIVRWDPNAMKIL